MNERSSASYRNSASPSNEASNSSATMDSRQPSLRHPPRIRTASEETCTADYLAGCDGAHSAVRKAIEVGFPGGAYDHMFYVADVAATGQVMNGELHIALDEADFLAVFPLHDNDHARLVGIVRTDMLENMDELLRGRMLVKRSLAGSAFKSITFTGSPPTTSITESPSISKKAASSCLAMPPTSTARSAAKA